MIRTHLTLLFWTFAVLGAQLAHADLNKQTIRNQLTLGLARQAADSAKALYSQKPDDLEVQQLYITSLARSGASQQALQLWKACSAHNEKPFYSSLEEICWAELHEGARRSSIKGQYIALFGAASSQQIRAIPLLKRSLKSSNPFFRSLAAQLSAYLGDAPLRKELLHTLQTEPSSNVQATIIATLGTLKEKQLSGLLHTYLSEQYPLEVQEAAAFALANLTETLSEKQLQALATSSHSGLKLAACYIVRTKGLYKELSPITALLEDSLPYVQEQAAYTLAMAPSLPKQATTLLSSLLLHSPNLKVQITTAFALARHGDQEAKTFLQEIITSKHSLEEKLAALGAIACLGPQSIDTMERFLLDKDSPPFIRLNSALYLLYWDAPSSSAIQELSEALGNHSLKLEEKSMIADFFPVFKESEQRHHPFIPNLPLVSDQLSRLKLIALLAYQDDPLIIERISEYLETKQWGVSLTASTLVLQELPIQAEHILHKLLDHSSANIRAQVSIILAAINRDHTALDTLYESFDDVNNETKLAIIEAIGNLASTQSIPFLVQQLQNPLASIRLMAAGALLRCING